MNVLAFFFLMLLLGLQVITSYGVIKAIFQRQWKRAGCLMAAVLTALVGLCFIPLPGAFVMLFTLLWTGTAVFLLTAMTMALHQKRWKLAAGVGLVAIAGYIYMDLNSKPDWRDGNITTYQMDSTRTRLGEDLSGGSYIELIGEDVIAVGSDKNWIVVQQRDPWDNTLRFYILSKDPDKRPQENVSAAMAQEAFEKEVILRSLPPFTWFK